MINTSAHPENGQDTINSDVARHQLRLIKSTSNAIIAGAIAAIITFAVFMTLGDGFEKSYYPMISLGLIAAGGTFVGSFIGHSLGRS